MASAVYAVGMIEILKDFQQYHDIFIHNLLRFGLNIYKFSMKIDHMCLIGVPDLIDMVVLFV